MKFEIFLIAFAFCCNIAVSYQWNGQCDFRETINITGGYKDDKGNHLHNGIIYSPGTFQLINFTMDHLNNKTPTADYVRGCICLYKPCIRFCCTDDECIKNSLFVPDFRENSEGIINLWEHNYGILRGRPCAGMYMLEPLDYPEDQWSFNSVIIDEIIIFLGVS